MKCPDCQNELQVAKLKGIDIHECLKCKGKWFERDELMSVKNKADNGLMMESLSKEIDRALSTLTERERDVVKLFFGIGLNHGLTLEEIGDKFDLTRERVRQIKEKAIRRLRHSSRSKLLQQYLG